MTLKKIARQASQDSPYRIELWDYVAEHMADRADIFGSAAETARAIAADPRFAQEPMLPDATVVCVMQETILNTAASLPLPKLRGTVKMNAEVSETTPFSATPILPTTTSTPSRKSILESGGTPTPWLPALTLSTMQDISLAQAS